MWFAKRLSHQQWIRGGVVMAISYNRLWKLLIDRNMGKGQLRKVAELSPNTLILSVFAWLYSVVRSFLCVSGNGPGVTKPVSARNPSLAAIELEHGEVLFAIFQRPHLLSCAPHLTPPSIQEYTRRFPQGWHGGYRRSDTRIPLKPVGLFSFW